MKPLATQNATYADFRLLTVGRDHNLGKLLLGANGGLKCINNFKHSWISRGSNNQVSTPLDDSELRESFCTALEAEIDRLNLPDADRLKIAMRRYVTPESCEPDEDDERALNVLNPEILTNDRQSIEKLILNFEAMRDGLVSCESFLDSLKFSDLLSKDEIDQKANELRARVQGNLTGYHLTASQGKSIKKYLKTMDAQKLQLFSVQMSKVSPVDLEAPDKLKKIAKCLSGLEAGQIIVTDGEADEEGGIQIKGLKYRFPAQHPDSERLLKGIKSSVRAFIPTKDNCGDLIDDIEEKLDNGELNVKFNGRKPVGRDDAEKKFKSLFGEDWKNLGYYFCQDGCVAELKLSNCKLFSDLPQSFIPRGGLEQVNTDRDRFSSSFRRIDKSTVEVELTTETGNISSLGTGQNKVAYNGEGTKIRLSVKFLVTLPNSEDGIPRISLVAGPKVSGDLDILKLGNE